MSGSLHNASAQKTAILSMDVEDWYHLEYFRREQCNGNVSLLNGLDCYLKILAEEQVPSSFFLLGELAEQTAKYFTQGEDVGVHGWAHRRPLSMTVEEFRQDTDRSKKKIEDCLGRKVEGYRAPCYSLDRARLDVLCESGFGYDSSRMDFASHPLYGSLDMQGFDVVRPWVYKKKDFIEFELSSLAFGRRKIPVSGGGYVRLLPWPLMKTMLERYLRRETFFVLYIHPFELSNCPNPEMPCGTPWTTQMRFKLGRQAVAHRIRMLIALLRKHGFVFSTFSAVRQNMLLQQSVSGVS
jgi:polysaccharide deacetylase family protein (PEP-CTERM system associated)